MTKHKHHGVVNKQMIDFAFKKHGFTIQNYTSKNNMITVVVEKDYSKDFNIKFSGLIRLEASVFENMFDMFCVYTYPTFKEISNIIPKKGFNHIYSDGSLCYAPPKRPLVEKWKFIDFVNAVDALIYNYFSIEYIGRGELFELEHGMAGLKQYEFICSRNLQRNKQ